MQYAGLWSITRYIRSEAANVTIPQTRPAYSFDQTRFDGKLITKMPPIDASLVQKGINGAINQQINQAVRAGQNVPQPKVYPGMRRF